MTTHLHYSAPRVLVIDAPGPAEPYEEPALADLVKTAAASVASLRQSLPSMNSPTATNIWRRADAHPVILALMLLDRYGDDVMRWRIDTLRDTLAKDGIALSNISWTKILGTRPLFTSPSAWRRWEIFHWICVALGGTAPNFEFFEMPRLASLVHGVNVMQLIDPKRTFGEEVDKFVASVLKHEGLTFVPAPLDFATRELEDPQLECKACHARHRDDQDTKCVTCGSSELLPVPYEFAAQRDAVKARWEALKGLPLVQAVERLKHDAVDNAVYTLLTEWDWAEDQKRALHQQLHSLRNT